MSAEEKPRILMHAIDFARVAQHIRSRITDSGNVLGQAGLRIDISFARELLESIEKEASR